MKKNILGIAIGIIISISSINSAHSADVGDLMTNMFSNTVESSTEGSTFETQRAGVLTGGRYSAKNHITRNMQVLGFIPPSVSAGCGGLSVFGGSFSFINGDQLVSYLRDIGTNAVGYFFQLALESSCPTCVKIMNTLNELASLANGQLGDSCSMAKSLVNKSGLGTLTQGLASSSAKATDAVLSPINNQLKDWHQGLIAKQTNGEMLKSIGIQMDVNIVHRKLSNSGFNSWVATATKTDKDKTVGTGTMPTMTELAMSLVGTFIYRSEPLSTTLKKTDGTNGSNGTTAKEQIIPTLIEPILNFKDFWGEEKPVTSSSSAEQVQTQSLSYYRCAPTGTSGTSLYNPKTTSYSVPATNTNTCVDLIIQTTQFKPFRHILTEFLTQNKDSLALKIRERQNTISDKGNYDKMKNFVSNVEFPIYAMLQDLSLHKDTASSFVSQNADFIALSYVRGMLEKTLDAVIIAENQGTAYNKRADSGISAADQEKFEQEQNTVISSLTDRVANIKKQINEEAKVFEAKALHSVSVMQNYEIIKNDLHKKMLNSRGSK